MKRAGWFTYPSLDEYLDANTLVLVDVECWFWIGPINDKGYGAFEVGQEIQRPYRLIYERNVGPIPKGKEPDHLCCNQQCVYFGHVEPVTHAVNCVRAWGGETHCPRGHERTEANTIIRRGRRECRTCKREADERLRERRRAEQGKTKRAPKVSREVAALIHARHAQGATQTAMAKEFGISQTAVWAVLKGKLWLAQKSTYLM